jgi:hypothetical protein
MAFLQRTSPTCGPHTINFQDIPTTTQGAAAFNNERKHVRLGVEYVNLATTDNYLYRVAATHPNLNSAVPSQTNVQILRVAVETIGALNPITMTAMSFNSKGVTPTEVDAAKLYYTGTSAVFTTTTQLGTTPPPATGGNLNFTFSQSLPPGVHYF